MQLRSKGKKLENARVLTSSEFLCELEEKERLRAEKETQKQLRKQQREEKKAQKTVAKKSTANPKNGSKGQLYSAYTYMFTCMHLLEKKLAYILPLNLPVSQVKMVIVMNQVRILLVFTLCMCLMQIFGM